MFEVFEHTADLGLRIRGADVAEVFAESGRGLFSLIVGNLEDVRPVEEKRYRIDGGQHDYLLFDWLSELLYTFESDRLLLGRFDVRVNSDGPIQVLEAICHGEKADFTRHRMEHEVKAITYHQLLFEQRDDGWLAEVIVDI